MPIHDIETLEVRIIIALTMVIDERRKTWRDIEYQLDLLCAINGYMLKCSNIKRKNFRNNIYCLVNKIFFL